MRLTLLLLSFLAIQLVRAQDLKESYNEKAIQFVYANQLDSAIVYFSKVIELSPNDEIAYLDRGLAYEKQHQFYEALNDFSKQQEIDSTMPDARFLKAILLEQLGDTASALKEYLHVTQLDFYNSDAHFYAARCYEQMNDLVAADSCYSRALRGNPYNFQVIPFYILCKVKAKNIYGIPELIAGIPPDYQDPTVPFSLGVLAYSQQKYAEANTQFRLAITMGYFSDWTLNQHCTEICTNKHFVKMLKNDWSASKELIEQSQVLETAMITGNWKFAEKHLKRLRSSANTIDLYRLNAIMAAKKGDLTSSLSWWEKVVALQPHHWNDEYSIALVYLNLKHSEKACEWYNRYLTQSPHPVSYQLYELCHSIH